jgi:16S rRNA (guanine527-N7)-methyltransferase
MSPKPAASRPSPAPKAGQKAGQKPRPKATHLAGPGGSRPVHWTPEQWQAGVTEVLATLKAATPLQEGLSDDLIAPLTRYMGQLAHWNATFNLTALRDPQDMLSHHLADCLTVLPAFQRHIDQLRAQGHTGPIRVLDVGSGGGLPGVVLAICLPDLQVTCVDTVGKKAAFIRQVAAELQLPRLKGEHARVEAMTGRFDIVTCRAFAALPDFVSWSRPRLAPGAIWLAMKGKQPDDEIAALPADVAVFHVEHIAVPGLDAERCLIWMRPQA